MTMRTSHHVLSAVLAAAGLALAGASAAPANTITMVSCSAAQPEPAPWDIATTAWMHASPGCGRGDGLTVWADIAGGPNLPGGSQAKWLMNVPPSLRIRRLRGEIRLNQGAGWAAGL